MDFEQVAYFGWSDTGEGLLEMITDALPDGEGVQLLRSLRDPALKQGRDTHQRGPCLLEMGMQAGQGNRRS